MRLRSELTELLAGFEKRMKFINIVRCLLEYRYPDQIRAMFPDKRILDNIVLAVLVYIKERTLGEEQTCTLSDIEEFLEDFMPALPEDCRAETDILARYIVVEVLQNGGVLTEFLTYDSVSETFRMMSVRLLNEERGSYHLTDDAFDFLFRSKEIESELDYSVTRFRMQEYMKRDNYEEALNSSRELVSRIRSMKLSMDDFLLRCRENISKITVDQYENVISRVRALLESEYEELENIRRTAESKQRTMEQAQENGVLSENAERHYRALREIIQNISLTIDEQRVLINKKNSMADSYQALIQDNFVSHRFERLNFERDIMVPLRREGAPLGNAAQFLLFMLTKPEFEKQFSIESFYAPQGKLTEQEEEEGVDISEEETEPVRESDIRNRRHRDIVEKFFQYAENRQSFSIQSFVEWLRVSELVEYCTENALPNVLLSLYAMQELDLEGWRNSTDRFASVPDGEFELAWCLEELSPQLLTARKMIFRKLDRTFSFSMESDGKKQTIEMTNFEVEVVL